MVSTMVSKRTEFVHQYGCVSFWSWYTSVNVLKGNQQRTLTRSRKKRKKEKTYVKYTHQPLTHLEGRKIKRPSSVLVSLSDSQTPKSHVDPVLVVQLLQHQTSQSRLVSLHRNALKKTKTEGVSLSLVDSTCVFWHNHGFS